MLTAVAQWFYTELSELFLLIIQYAACGILQGQLVAKHVPLINNIYKYCKILKKNKINQALA